MTTSHRTTPDDPGAARAATAVDEPPLDALLRLFLKAVFINRY